MNLKPEPLTLRDIREASTNYLRACLKEDIDVTTHDMISEELHVREQRRSIPNDDEHMNQTQFVAEVYKIASAYIPAIDDSSSFQDVIKDLEDMKTNALKFEIVEAAFKPEPQLPRIPKCDI